MRHVNIEIKAICRDPDAVRRVLRAQGARFVGTDRQVDTYFRIDRGRLKLREGRIENCLIYYEREDVAGPKRADVTLFKTESGSGLKEILTRSLGVLTVVVKRRETVRLMGVLIRNRNQTLVLTASPVPLPEPPSP